MDQGLPDVSSCAPSGLRPFQARIRALTGPARIFRPFGPGRLTRPSGTVLLRAAPFPVTLHQTAFTIE